MTCPLCRGPLDDPIVCRTCRADLALAEAEAVAAACETSGGTALSLAGGRARAAEFRTSAASTYLEDFADRMARDPENWRRILDDSTHLLADALGECGRCGWPAAGGSCECERIDALLHVLTSSGAHTVPAPDAPDARTAVAV